MFFTIADYAELLPFVAITILLILRPPFACYAILPPLFFLIFSPADTSPISATSR